jgi:hypothetical protein
MGSSAVPSPAAIRIAARFCGPPGSGNGGYTCGRLAAGMRPPVEVTLRRPPPLDRELRILRNPQGQALMDGDAPVAEARHARLELVPPPCPGLGAATAAAARYHGLAEHAFPTCFVCGPGRAAGDGLRIFAGEVPDDSMVAAPWRPDSGLAGADGRVDDAFVWAALDCPGAWAWLAALDDPLVLGRLTAEIDAPVMAGQPHVVGGWRLGREGRKYYSGTAIWRADGTICARARATWIQVDPERFGAAG